MTESQRLSIRSSEIRARLNELNGVEALTDETRAEMDRLTVEYPDVERRYRAALITEDEVEVQGSQDADGETRATLDLLRESRISRFVEAAENHRQVDGAEADLLAALSLGNTAGAFPLRLLDSRLDADGPGGPGREERADVATDLGADDEQTAITVRPWIDRVFLANTAVTHLGVTRETIGTGDRRYVVIMGGTDASDTVRGAREDAAAMTIATKEVAPRRASCGYLYRREDIQRHGGGLEAALRRDMRMVLSEYMDDVVVMGVSGASGFGGLITTGSSKIISTQQTMAVGGETNSAYFPGYGDIGQSLAAQVDGRYAAMLSDLRVLLSRTIYQRLSWQLNDARVAETKLSMLRGAGIPIAANNHLPTATTANTIVGIISRGRGLSGSLMLPVWESATLIADPYSRAPEAEVRLTLTVLYGAPTMVRAANWAQIKGTVGSSGTSPDNGAA